jgi:FkbM family methyltransferase
MFGAGRQGLRHGVAAAVEHRRALHVLDLATVVDIGANKGQFALYVRSAFPDAAIYSFEPLREPAARLRATLGNRVKLFETAIGPSATEATIYVSKQVDSSSLLPIAQQSEVFPGTGLKETRTVRVAPLSECLVHEDIQAQALLKIDVQGYELEALKGCDPLLPLFRYIYVEGSFIELYRGQVLVGDLICYLSARKFQLAGVYNQVDDSGGRAVQADFLFVNAGDLQGATEERELAAP